MFHLHLGKFEQWTLKLVLKIRIYQGDAKTYLLSARILHLFFKSADWKSLQKEIEMGVLSDIWEFLLKITAILGKLLFLMMNVSTRRDEAKKVNIICV